MNTRLRVQKPQQLSKTPESNSTETTTAQEQPLNWLIQLARQSPGELTPDDIMQLQRQIGNRAVSDLLAQKQVQTPTTFIMPKRRKHTLKPSTEITHLSSSAAGSAIQLNWFKTKVMGGRSAREFLVGGKSKDQITDTRDKVNNPAHTSGNDPFFKNAGGSSSITDTQKQKIAGDGAKDDKTSKTDATLSGVNEGAGQIAGAFGFVEGGLGGAGSAPSHINVSSSDIGKLKDDFNTEFNSKSPQKRQEILDSFRGKKDSSDAKAKENAMNAYVEDKRKVTFNHDAHARDALITASSGVGAVTSGVGSAASFIGMVQTIKQWSSAEGWEQKTEIVLNSVGSGAQGTISAGQSAANAVGMTAGAVATGLTHHADGAAGPKDSFSDMNAAQQATAVTGDISSGASGVIDSLGALGSAVELVISAGKLGINTVGGFMDVFGEKQESVWDTLRERGASFLTDGLKILKSFLSMANSAISAAKWFLSIAGTAAEFITTVPIIGSAIGIVMKMIDILIEGVEVIRRTYKWIKAAVYMGKLDKMKDREDKKAPYVFAPNPIFTPMSQLHPGGIQPKRKTDKSSIMRDEKGDLIAKTREINKKRLIRNIIPAGTESIKILADVGGICADVLNIVGVATSAAYGAGVAIMATGYSLKGAGAATKLAMSAVKPSMAAARFIKQKGRDAASKRGPNSKFNKVFDAKKSTEKKNKEYTDRINDLFKLISQLPNYDANNEDTKQEYSDVETLIKAIGVSPKKLATAGSPNKMVAMLMKAMKARE